ncbi:MAG: hypothetical protein JF603_02155 [Acidobacteria bacterium]|nr:hypothetical protein [Acidobacteriota bacterium]
MSGMPIEMLTEVDELAALPHWSVHDLRPDTRRVLAAMPAEAVQCALALSRSQASAASRRLTHRALVVLACHDHGDPFSGVLDGARRGCRQLAFAG